MRPTDALPHPTDWRTTTVRRSVEVRRGVSWSKEQEHTEPAPNRMPVVGIKNVRSRLQLNDLLYLSGLQHSDVERGQISAGWTVLVGSNGNRDRVGNAVLIDDDANFLFASFLISAKPKPDSGLRPDYFFRWLTTEQVQSSLSASAEGTTGLSNLSHSFLKNMSIPLPPPGEQSAISRILDAVDTVIQCTHEARVRAENLRCALLQSSFEFVGWKGPWKDTASGRIPLSWDAISGRRAFVVATSGCSSVDALTLPSDGSAPDAWFMKVDDFNDPANRRAIVRTKIGFRMSDNELFKVHPIGTVVIAKRGAAIMKNRVRTLAVPVSIDPNLMALKVLPEMHPEFLRLQLEWRNIGRYVENSGVPQLNNKDLYPRYFLRPPQSNQVDIIETLCAVEGLEDALIAKSNVLEGLKKSLMHDLLSGKVRVVGASTVAAS